MQSNSLKQGSEMVYFVFLSLMGMSLPPQRAGTFQLQHQD